MIFATKKYVQNLLAGVLKQRKDKYSTEETIVGEYADGRPIYRVVLTGVSMPKCSSGGTAKYVSIDLSQYNIDVITRMWGETDLSTSSTHDVRIIPYWAYGSCYVVQLIYHPSTKILQIGNSSTGYNSSVVDFICIEYTKTTDEATS